MNVCVVKGGACSHPLPSLCLFFPFSFVFVPGAQALYTQSRARFDTYQAAVTAVDEFTALILSRRT